MLLPMQALSLAGLTQTSWLFTKGDRGFELGTTEKQILLMAGWKP